MKAETINKKIILLLALIWLASCLPLFLHGIDDRGGQDLSFHLLRIEGIVEGLESGQFPVRIQPNWLEGYGYATGIFYGDLLLYLPAVLRILGLPILLSYKIYAATINLLTVLVAHWSFKRIFKAESSALVCTAVYTLATYRLVNVYVRQAVGEYSAMIFLPLIAAAVYGLYTEAVEDWKEYSSNSIMLAIGMSGLIYTHMLTTEMTVIVLACVCIFFFKKTFRKNTLRAYGRAVWLTLLLGAAFLVPFIDYYINVPVVITSGLTEVNAIQQEGVHILDFFYIFKNPFGSSYSGIEYNRDGLMLLSVGLVMLATLAVAIVLLVIRRREADRRLLPFTIFSAVSLWVSSNLFPWDFIAYSVPGGTFLAQVQFPWRYLVIADVFLTLLLGVVLEELKEAGRYIIPAIIGIQLMLTVVFFGYYVAYADLHTFDSVEELNTTYIGGEEYLRTGTDLEELLSR